MIDLRGSKVVTVYTSVFFNYFNKYYAGKLSSIPLSVAYPGEEEREEGYSPHWPAYQTEDYGKALLRLIFELYFV